MSRHSPLFAFLVALPLLVGCSTATAPMTPTAAAAPTTGSLVVTVAGLSEGQADITVTGPSGFDHSITGTTTLADLTPGEYTIVASTVVMGGSTRCCTSSVPTPESQAVAVSASAAPATATVTYKGPERN